MALISKQSLELLKEKIDLVDIISTFIPLSRSGSHYKALCPFHNEKSPSFSLSPGDKYYHCFGCGAHGDAITFLMEHSKLSFSDSLNFLAEKYNVTLENEKDDQGPPGACKSKIKEALSMAEDFYNFCMMHTYDGQKSADYASKRKLDQSYIDTFKLGYSPKNGALSKYLKGQGVDQNTLIDAGLMNLEKKTDFFFDRFMIPIHDAMGACIGFTARKLDEEAFGGKYINTQETAVFKKSHVLFGLKFSRARIIKEKKALVCEGQIDAMRLIHSGYNWTVASQGTAFGQAHVQILKKLGITQVYLAFDGDHAGVQASMKVGEYFMQEQISVHVLALPTGNDPDVFLLERGKKGFDELILSSKSYLEFLYDTCKKNYDLTEPSEKNRLVLEIKKIITDFKDPVLIHESLKKLALLAEIPEKLLGISGLRSPRIKASSGMQVDKDEILDLDVLRFYYLAKLQKLPVATLFDKNKLEFMSENAQKLYMAIADTSDLETMPFMASIDPSLHPVFESLFNKKINRLKLVEGAKDSIHKLLEREWLQKREELQNQMMEVTDEKDQLKLTFKMTLLLKSPPKLEGLETI